MKRAASLLPMLREFIGFAPGKLIIVLLLMLIASLSSGFSITLILPLLQAIGIEQLPPDSASALTTRVFEIADYIGVHFTLARILLCYLLLMVIISAVNYCSAIATTQLNKHYSSALRNLLYRQVLCARWSYLQRQRSTDYIRLITNQVQSLSGAFQQLLSIANSLGLIVVYLIIAIAVSPALTAIAVALGLVLVLLVTPLNRAVQDSGKTQLWASRQLFHSALEELYNLKIIKSFGAEQHYISRMQSIGDTLEQQQLRINRYNAMSKLVSTLGASAIFALLFYLALTQLALNIGSLVLLLLIFTRLLPQLNSVQTSVQRILHSAPMFDDVQATLSQLNNNQEQSTAAVPALSKAIVLTGVNYCYHDAVNSVYPEALNIHIAANSTVAITGPSGIGKSTLVDIISGIISPSQGSLRVDESLIDATNRVDWRRQMAYVTQETLLFNDTLRANLTWVCSEDCSDEQIWLALEQAHATEFVKKLTHGLDTVIGDRGSLLSGGERQRLALARALLSQPRVLILDEATNAIDTDAVGHIKAALTSLRGQITIIVIAHHDELVIDPHQTINLSHP